MASERELWIRRDEIELLLHLLKRLENDAAQGLRGGRNREGEVS